jgi:HPr kinase/phosphorylase
VADDRVDILAGCAAAPAALAGLLEVRGLGIMRLPYLPSVPLALAVELGVQPARLPAPQAHGPTGLPLIGLNGFQVSAAQRVELALGCALGEVPSLAGAFAA